MELQKMKTNFRREVPRDHKTSIDTRLQWLWNQRFGTVQTVYQNSRDQLDVTAATILIQAVLMQDLDSIAMLFRRLEGGALVDEALAEMESLHV